MARQTTALQDTNLQDLQRDEVRTNCLQHSTPNCTGMQTVLGWGHAITIDQSGRGLYLTPKCPLGKVDTAACFWH